MNYQQAFTKRVPLWALVVCIVLALGIIVALASHRSTSSKQAALSKSQTSKTQSKTTKSPTKTSNQTPSTNKSAGVGTSNSNVAANTACKLLSPSVATQTLGTSAAASTPSDTSALVTPDTSLGACAYTGSNETVQLIVRTPKNSLGASENATHFGSEKPANATSVSGYGQSAYWDPDAKQLNILANNNWYIISRSTGSSDDSEAVAKLLASGF
jgi:cytoskeletal protein RodZ